MAKPQSIHVDLHGTGTGSITEAVLEDKILDLIGGATPRSIREHLGLNKPIYARTSSYGHFGRTPDADGGFSWEKTDLVDQLKALA
ncbi:MAG: S-adenosylmethionine synthetase [Brevundimonas sp.]|nr:S-adenosylmethionine synthetase [Brevundimonas sp.]